MLPVSPQINGQFHEANEPNMQTKTSEYNEHLFLNTAEFNNALIVIIFWEGSPLVVINPIV